MDILKDGRLDLDDDVLAELDVVVVSVHSYMNLERSAMTERLLAAIENPYTQIIGHPTGRLLLRRDDFAYDMEKILDAARQHGVAMECNAAPDRLDLKDVYLRMAKERGVRVVISTDAHATRGLESDALRRAAWRGAAGSRKKTCSTRCRSRKCWPRCVPGRAKPRECPAPSKLRRGMF